MWNTDRAFVEEVWPDAAEIPADVYLTLMLTANSLCVAYAPALPEGTTVSDSWKLAEIFQARDTWSKLNGGNREEFGPDGMSIPVYPLVFVARDLLRPKTSPLGKVR